MPKGEFQNRDRDESNDTGIPLLGDELGELSEELADERGDLDTYSTHLGPPSHPDMQISAQDRSDAARTGLGSPTLDFTVRSIFDSRPTQAKEFNLWFGVSWPCSSDFADNTALNQCFFVPAGYVACLRRVELVAEADPLSMLPYEGYLEVMADNAVRDPIDVPPGPVASNGSSADQVPGIMFTLPARVDTFVLIDEKLSVGARLTFAAASLQRPNLRVGFHGTFLLKTGVPAMFQAANEAGRARTAVTSSAADIGNIASGSDLVVRKRRRIPFAHVPLLRQRDRR
jgi:hypothetical protein